MGIGISQIHIGRHGIDYFIIDADTVLANPSNYDIYVKEVTYKNFFDEVACITFNVIDKQNEFMCFMDVDVEDSNTLSRLLKLHIVNGLFLIPKELYNTDSSKIYNIKYILDNLYDYSINEVYIEKHAVRHTDYFGRSFTTGYRACGKFEVTYKKSGYTFDITAHNEDAIRLEEVSDNTDKINRTTNKITDTILKNRLIHWLRDVSIITNYEYVTSNYSGSEYNGISLVFNIDADKDSDELRYLIKDALIRDLSLHEQVYEVNCNNSLNKNTEHVMNIDIVI